MSKKQNKIDDQMKNISEDSNLFKGHAKNTYSEKIVKMFNTKEKLDFKTKK